jgi:hypothetical protein
METADHEYVETPIPGHVPRGERDEPEPEPQKDPAPKVDPELKKLQADLKRETARRKEAEDGMRFWSEKAGREASAERAPKPDKEEEAEKLTVDLVEAITNGDAKQIKAAMRELGFVQKGEVSHEIDSKIGTTKAQIVHEAKLYKEYPDLEDENSELFEKTKEVYTELVAKDKDLQKSPKLVEMAARIAQAELGKTAGKPKPKSKTEPDEDEDEPEFEADRQERVRSQQGSRGRRTSDPQAGRDSEELTSQQKSIVEKFRAAGADINEDKYRARAKKGVQMSGLPGRGR